MECPSGAAPRRAGRGPRAFLGGFKRCFFLAGFVFFLYFLLVFVCFFFVFFLLVFVHLVGCFGGFFWWLLVVPSSLVGFLGCLLTRFWWLKACDC